MRSFIRDIYSFQDKYEEEVLKKKKDLAKSILIRLADVTPVDTAQAVSNWRIGLNAPQSGIINPHSWHNGLTSSATAVNVGMLIIDAAKIKDAVFIGNNVDYLEELNKGKSLQAEANFIETAVEEAITENDK